mgnify:FL=1
MKIKPPHKKASVEDLIQWMKNRQWTTTLRSEEKNIILKELADEMFLEHPFTGKRLRFILMNQRKDLWEKDTLKSPLIFAKPYQEEWSFDRISKTLLRAYIRHAFYFDKEKSKGKEYQTFQVNLSDETIEKLKKMQGDRSQLAFMNELVDEFLMLPYPVRDKLISQAKEMIKNPV